MDYENERYIKVYVRDTLNWAALGWEGQAILALLMRKMDRVGIVDIGSLDPVAALAALTGMPREIAAIAWPRLSAPEDPALVLRGGKTAAIFMPNFLPGQEANQSDTARQKKSRETRRARELLTVRDTTPPGSHQEVTARDKTSLLAAPAALASPADLVKQQPRAIPETKSETPDAAALPDGWDRGLYDRLQKQLGRNDADTDWQVFVGESLKIPTPQRHAAVEAYLERKSAVGEHRPRYVLTMMQKAVIPSSGQSRPQAASVSSHGPSKAAQLEHDRLEREHREEVRKERADRKAKGLPPFPDAKAFVRNLASSKTMPNGKKP